MPAHVRRTIEELLQRYKREPTIRDLYVEGTSDKDFYGWLLYESGVRDVNVYLIETINVPAVDVLKICDKDNNRCRIVALAARACHALGDNNRQFTAVADRDLSTCVTRPHLCVLLHWTDFTDALMYLIDRGALESLFRNTLHVKVASFSGLFDSLETIGTELFLLRIANDILDWRMRRVDFAACCTIIYSGAEIARVEFNREEYLRRYLGGSGHGAEREAFEKVVLEYRDRLPEEFRLRCNGHDYFRLLRMLVHEACNHHGFAEEGALANILGTIMTRTQIEKWPQISQLMRTLAALNENRELGRDGYPLK